MAIYANYRLDPAEFPTVTMWGGLRGENFERTIEFSVAFVVQSLLQELRNQVIQVEDGCFKWMAVTGLTVGFALNTLFAAMETVVRVMVAPLFAIAVLFAVFYDLAKKDGLSDLLREISFFGPFLSGCTILQSAVSAYTNCAYANSQIDYQGQATRYIYGRHEE